MSNICTDGSCLGQWLTHWPHPFFIPASYCFNSFGQLQDSSVNVQSLPTQWIGRSVTVLSRFRKLCSPKVLHSFCFSLGLSFHSAFQCFLIEEMEIFVFSMLLSLHTNICQLWSRDLSNYASFDLYFHSCIQSFIHQYIFNMWNMWLTYCGHQTVSHGTI